MNKPYPSAPHSYQMQPPPEFVCPISMDLMREPVLCEDGHTYERSVIIQWLATNPTSPTTRQPMSPANIRPNYALKAAIERWSKPVAPRLVLPPPPPPMRQTPIQSPPTANTNQSFFSVPFSYQPQQTYNGYMAIPMPPIPTSQPSVSLRTFIKRRIRPHIIPCFLYLIIIGVFVYMWHEGMFG